MREKHYVQHLLDPRLSRAINSPDDFDSFFLNESNQLYPCSDFISKQSGSVTFPDGKVLHQTPIEAHTATDSTCAAAAKASPSRPGNCTVPSAVPLKKDGIDPFEASQLVPGSGEGQNTSKPQEIDSCM